MENPIIRTICNSCSCNETEAQEYLDDEIRNLRELSESNDLRYEDMEQACADLGLENDYVPYFINVLSA